MHRVYRQDLPCSGMSHDFVGDDHGDVNVSAFFVGADQGGFGISAMPPAERTAAARAAVALLTALEATMRTRSRTVICALGLLAASAFAPAAAAADARPLQTVPRVDLARYVGTWYEIASYPQRFQKGCTGTVATYSIRDDGMIEVINRCSRDSLTGRITVAKGRAKVVDKVTNARLKVTFFWPFSGNYWVIGLDENYRWAVVGDPGRKYLWILSRTPVLGKEEMEKARQAALSQGYDLEKLIQTVNGN